MARNRRSRSSSPVVAFLKKDPFGVIWFALLFIAVMIAKWWYLQPPAISTDDCLVCVTALIVIMAIVITLLLTLFWILWTAKRQKKNIVFLFLICLGVLGCTALLDFASQKLFGRLYYMGLLHWQAADITYLLDDFLRHSAGLYLGVLMAYAMARIAVDSGFEPRKYVIPINFVFIGVAAFLLLVGLVLY
jgi:hypothetical protein